MIFRNCSSTCGTKCNNSNLRFAANVFTPALYSRRHKKLCHQDKDVVITMRMPGKDDHKFINLTARWYVRTLIYLDLESLLLPVYGLHSDRQKSRTRTNEIHLPCGYASAVIEFGKKDLLKFELKRGLNVMEGLISSLEPLARQIYVEKESITLSPV